MAIRGTMTTIGRRANSSCLFFPVIPTYLRTTTIHVPASSHPFCPPISHPNTQSAFKYSIRAIQGATVDPVAPRKEDEEQLSENWKIKMLYDGECPLCMREVNMLRERNKQYGTIKFVDISSGEYSPKENQDLDYKTVMGRIHAILSNGTVVTDVEALRRLYEAVDLGWVYAITKYEPFATIVDALYGVWAKYRLQITGLLIAFEAEQASIICLTKSQDMPATYRVGFGGVEEKGCSMQ